ncbi:MAG: hypothetical protein CAF45_001510 [Nitrospira sp. CG24E]|nr:MAG: hypothetical protein CAF45_001510 [Nitrospira sp. CG24E]
MSEHASCRPDSSRKATGLWPKLLIGMIGIGLLLAGLPAHASESQTPWECSNYTGDAHTRCLAAFVETQRDQIATLQGKMQAQQETVNYLKGQLDRQASSNADLQRRLAQPPAVVQTAPLFYSYPSVGLGLSFGSPWIHGPSYFYSPFFYGPRYYGLGYWGHRW